MKKITMIAVLAVLSLLVMPLTAEAGGRPLSADLASANEVPPSGTGATGSAWVTLNQGQNQVCFSLEAQGLAGTILAGHIHAAPAGLNGPVVVNLGLSPSNLGGCIDDVPAELIKAIRQSPGEYYINVHTTSVPSGEIRGQLTK